MTLMTRQALARTVEVTGAVAELVYDFGLYPVTKVEGVVQSSVVATFTIYKSVNGIAWRKITEIKVEANDLGIEQPFLSSNGYRYIKIVTATVGNHLIEVAGA